MTIDGKAVKEISIDGKLWWASRPTAIVFADSAVKQLLLTQHVYIDYVDTSNTGSPGLVDRNVDGEISVTEAARCGSFYTNAAGTSTLFYSNTDITAFNELQYFTGLRTLGNLFYGCKKLKSVELPVPGNGAATSTGDAIFIGCRALTGVVIPNGWVTIGADFFRNCTTIALIDIPATCSTIGASFTRGTYSFPTIVCRATMPPTFGGYGWGGEPNSVYVPDASVAAYKSASGWKAYPNAIKPLSTYTES